MTTTNPKKFSIYHNPRCSKSRAALAWLQEQGIEPLTAPAIEELLTKLGLGVRDILRDSEDEFTTLQLADPKKTNRELIAALVDHPVLLQRPIVVCGNRAVVARPTEKLAELL